jgi:FPC/CPF motif-containing protein YcgG
MLAMVTAVSSRKQRIKCFIQYTEKINAPRQFQGVAAGTISETAMSKIICHGQQYIRKKQQQPG